MGGGERGAEAGGSGRRGTRGGGVTNSFSFSPSPWGSEVFSTVGVGVVNLLTSPDSLVGDDNERLISVLLGVVDLLTSGVAWGDTDLLTSEGEVIVGVADLLNSDGGGTGSVETYLLDSETVERGREVIF